MTGIGSKMVGLVASPEFVELITRIMARALWKIAQVFERSPRQRTDRFEDRSWAGHLVVAQHQRSQANVLELIRLFNCPVAETPEFLVGHAS